MSRARFALVIATMAAGAAFGQRTAVHQPRFDDRFGGDALDAAWVVDVSPGNSIRLRDGILEIEAAENTYAHLERALAFDHVRAATELQAGNGISWATSLFVYWGPGAWCQVGVIPRDGGRFYACVTAGGTREEHDLARCRFEDWHTLGIEVGEDCLRFVTRALDGSWTTQLVLPRPAALAGPAALLVVGKGFGLDDTSPDLDGDYGARGAVAVSRIRRVTVEELPAERRRWTDAERRAQEATLSDPRGREILERAGDPDFETVAALYPPLAKPREAVGVKDHPYEVGVEYDGTVQLADDTDLWEQTGATAYFEIGASRTRFGTGGCRKRLLEGFLPVVIATWEHEGLRCEQTVAGWSESLSPDRELWAYVKLTVSNLQPEPYRVEVALQVQPESADHPTLRRTVEVPAGGAADLFFRIPSPLKGRALGEVTPAEWAARLAEIIASWRRLLDAGMTIDVPEQRVNDAARAWLAYGFLDVDKKDGRCEPHDGAGFYEAVFGYSAVLYCHALDLWGRHEDARRYLESLLTMVKPDGLFYVNYGLPDHGSLLITLAEHYRLTGDAAWLQATAPVMIKMADRLLALRDEAISARMGRSAQIRGLIQAAPYADYQTPTYNYYGNAYACAALSHVAEVLGEIGRADDARRYADAAVAYRADILASMQASAFEHEGQWLLPMEPDTRRLLRDGRYRTGGYYGLVAPMMLETQLLAADDPHALLVVRGLEKRGGLTLGMAEFNEGIDHAYTYGYWLNCLDRGEIERVLLGFYGSLAYGMGRETYCGVEVTQLTTGEPTPTTPHLYSSTQQLRLLRMMLVREEGNDLVIGRAIPRPWLAPGKRVVVRGAPTRFGPVSFTMEAITADRITVALDPPRRRPPDNIRVYVRHPEGKAIRSATVDGRLVTGAEADVVVFDAPDRAVLIGVTY